MAQDYEQTSPDGPVSPDLRLLSEPLPALPQDVIDALNSTGYHWVLAYSFQAGGEVEGVEYRETLSEHRAMNMLLYAAVNVRYFEMGTINALYQRVARKQRGGWQCTPLSSVVT